MAALRAAMWSIGMFWERCTVSGALVAAIGSAVLSLREPTRRSALRVEPKDVDYSTSTGFNLGALAIVAILIALYATWW